jgi:hypothetical protein
VNVDVMDVERVNVGVADDERVKVAVTDCEREVVYVLLTDRLSDDDDDGDLVSELDADVLRVEENVSESDCVDVLVLEDVVLVEADSDGGGGREAVVEMD